MYTSVLCLCVILLHVWRCQSSICMSWKLQDNQLRITCTIDKIVLDVKLYDPFGVEVAYCLIPFPRTTCLSTNNNSTVIQDLHSGETVYITKSTTTNDHNGIWSCVHGKDNSKVNILVSDNSVYELLPRVTFNGQRYVQKHTQMTLLCTTNTDPIDPLATFYVDNKMYTTLHRNTSGCFSSFGATECNTDSCQCFPNGRSYILHYSSMVDSGTLAFRCSMDFKNVGSVSDCIFVSVVDITGPLISASETFPLTAGTVVDLTCTSTSRESVLEISMNCLATSTQSSHSSHDSIKNETTYVASLSKLVTSKDNGKTCYCKIVSKRLQISETIILQIIRAPIIHLQTQFVCNSSESAVLSCNLSGELSTFGFSGWIHSSGGTLLRQLDGNISGKTSLLEIKNCSFDDRGDYLCSAWNEDYTDVFLQNATTSLFVAGPPEIIETDIIIGDIATLSVQFFSPVKPNQPKWYVKNKIVTHSKLYNQSLSKEVIATTIYGRIKTIHGYVAKLRMPTNSADTIYCTVVLENEFGTTMSAFNLNNDSAVFHIRSIIWILIATFIFLITVVVITVFIWRRKNGFHERSSPTAVYFGAPQIDNNVNIYSETMSNYDEIDDGDLFPVNAGLREHSSPRTIETMGNYEEIDDGNLFPENQDDNHTIEKNGDEDEMQDLYIDIEIE
ncbi:unnamed protein product [Mytilus coruscus]|uniref:Ig-like domain-containing protein n=1 Tax=Mytilus coruscus TaxID=42192 RepID=A0A6J8DHY0_MYTCO|nr:unnamed protein product [Mytilus coruscus]